MYNLYIRIMWLSSLCMPEYIYKLEEADRADESFFGSFTEYSLCTVIVRRYVYFKDWFCGGLSFRNEVFVLVTT